MHTLLNPHQSRSRRCIIQIMHEAEFMLRKTGEARWASIKDDCDYLIECFEEGSYVHDHEVRNLENRRAHFMLEPYFKRHA